MIGKSQLARRLSPLIGAASGVLAMSMAAAMPTVYPTGVTIYDHDSAYPCDLLFAAPDFKTYLIDMAGHVLRKWDHSGEPAKMVDPALYGGVKGVVGFQLRATPMVLAKPTPAEKSVGAVGLIPGALTSTKVQSFGFVDWTGNTLWQWGKQAPGGEALQNHDWDLLPNGDVLILSYVVRRLPGFGDRPMVDDTIYEVDKAGRIVWRWPASEHLGEFGFTPDQMKLVERSEEPDFLHVNDMEVLGPNRWEKAGDARFAPDNIMVSSFLRMSRSSSTGRRARSSGGSVPITRPATSRNPKPCHVRSTKLAASMTPT